MHLSQRSRCQRGLFESDKLRQHRLVKFLLDHAPDGGKRDRWNLILQSFQLAGELRRQDIYPRREELADFDQHASHLYGYRPERSGSALQPLLARLRRANLRNPSLGSTTSHQMWLRMTRAK